MRPSAVISNAAMILHAEGLAADAEVINPLVTDRIEAAGFKVSEQATTTPARP
jgi:hypothetical protein